MTENFACSKCGRALYRKDADALGRCCFCQPEAEPETAELHPDKPRRKP